MSTRTSTFWETMAEKIKVKVAYPPQKKTFPVHFQATHCRNFYLFLSSPSPKSKVPKSRPTGLGQTLKSNRPISIDYKQQTQKQNLQYMLLRNVFFQRGGQATLTSIFSAIFSQKVDVLVLIRKEIS